MVFGPKRKKRSDMNHPHQQTILFLLHDKFKVLEDTSSNTEFFFVIKYLVILEIWKSKYLCN
jgi:hypothetical protein